MLGWFKKKFGKQDKAKELQPVEQEVTQQIVAEKPDVIQEVAEEKIPDQHPVQTPEVAETPPEPVQPEEPEAPATEEEAELFEPVAELEELEIATEKQFNTVEENAEHAQPDIFQQEKTEVIAVVTDLEPLEDVESQSEPIPVIEEITTQEELPALSEVAEPEPEIIVEEFAPEPEPVFEHDPETAIAVSAVEREEEETAVLEEEETATKSVPTDEESIEETAEEEIIVADVSEPAGWQEEEPPKPQYQQPAEKPSMPKRNFKARSRESSTSSGLFSRLSKRLSKTRESFTYQMDALFLGKKEIDINLLDDLEEILILADLGVNTTQDLLEHARRRVKRKELKDPGALRQLLKDKISEYIVSNDQDAALVMPEEGPFVIMVIGVNGVGKTTTIGKIAKKFINAGSSVMLVAADTFRAAAIAQLQIWGDRNNVPVIAHKEGSDPSSVVYDGLDAALAQQVDVVLVDTAGRLHTKANLMEELKKIKRVMNKRLPGAPHETLLVIDATTGQNGVSQAKLFNEAVEVTGLALTKLDGTSKGGIVANICKDLKIPIRFIGIGEQVDDLRDFDSGEFVDALFQSRSNNE